MSRAEMLSAKLNSLNREIEDVADQRVIFSLTNPLANRHRILLSRREAVQAELQKLKTNIVKFPMQQCVV